MIALASDTATVLERLVAASSSSDGPRWRSLDPVREHARTLHEVGRRVLDRAADSGAAGSASIVSLPKRV